MTVIKWIHDMLFLHEMKQVVVNTQDPLKNIPPHSFNALIMYALSCDHAYFSRSSSEIIKSATAVF